MNCQHVWSRNIESITPTLFPGLAALALLLVLFAVGLLLVESRIRGRAAYYRLGAGAARRARPVPLGRWRYPALAFTGTVITSGADKIWLANIKLAQLAANDFAFL